MWLHAKLGKDRIIGKSDISRCKLESPNHPIGAFGVQMPKKPTPTPITSVVTAAISTSAFTAALKEYKENENSDTETDREDGDL